MQLQHLVERFAQLARPRVDTLLRLQSVEHIYDLNPGKVNDRTTFDGVTIIASKFKQAIQPYRNLSAFTTDERIMPHVIDAGLVPVVKALMQETRGQKYLLTRRIAANPKGVCAYIEDIGIRIQIYTEDLDTIVAWETLYGVATPRKV